MSEPYVINEDGWAAIPEPLLYNPKICAEAVRVYGVLRRHGDDPANCYPSHSRIAGFIGKSPRSIPGWIRQLEKAGWVERFARKSPFGDPDSNGYRVFGRVGERGVRAEEQGPSAVDSREGSTPHSAPKESNEEREPLNEKTHAVALVVAASFDEFWSAYPRKVGKPAGAKAFATAIKRSSPEAIFAGLRRHLAAWATWPKDKRQYIPHASTWLNRDGWNDEVESHVSSRSKRDQQADAIPGLIDAIRGYEGFDDGRKALNEG